MKLVIKIYFIFVLFILVASCATTQRILPEKYNLDGYLEAVDQISVHRVKDWQNVDNQSLLLKINLNDYYLLVLRRPITTKYPDPTIDVSNTASKDKAYSAQEIIGDRNTAGKGPNTKFVQAPSNIASVKAGHDRITVTEHANTEYYIIEKIYKLKDYEQAEKIKEWLRRN